MTYEASYRRGEVAIPVLVGLVVALFVGVFVIVKFLSWEHAFNAMMYLIGGVVLVMAWVMLTLFRVHRWIIDNDGLQIEERPRLPLMGIRRVARLAHADIAALRHVESGLDRMVEVVAANGEQYRLPQKLTASASGIPTVDTSADLGAFVEQIRASARRAGIELPPTLEGLSFWNRYPGLAVLAMVLAIAMAFAGAIVWALFNGFNTVRPRGGEMIVVSLLLPVGAGWLLWKSIRRRRGVLANIRTGLA